MVDPVAWFKGTKKIEIKKKYKVLSSRLSLGSRVSHHAWNISVYASYPGIIFKSAAFHFQNCSGMVFNWRI